MILYPLVSVTSSQMQSENIKWEIPELNTLEVLKPLLKYIKVMSYHLLPCLIHELNLS